MIIVGSGIWGELLAAKRSAAGVKVAILEAGATGQSHGGDVALLGRTDQGP
jgi:choline dehydrogenase-like flavoprotein